VTDVNGEIFLEGLLIGDYKVKELASDLNVGYILSEEENAVVAADQITEMAIHNKLISGMVKILKVDADTGGPVQDAVFGLRDMNGNLLAEAESGRDGWAYFMNVTYGDYEVFEIKAAKGYRKTDAVYLVQIHENDVIIEFEIPNEKIPSRGKIPDTGDNSAVLLWGGVAVISAAAITCLLMFKKRKSKKA